MTDWTDVEQAALLSFLAAGGPLKSALEKFVAEQALAHKTSCANAMATVPRNPEVAADNAAKAQLLDEFWELLTDEALIASSATGSREPTPRDLEE